VEISAYGITAPAAVYEIAGRRFEIGARDFADAIADAYAAHQRPRCLCLAEGVEMYVARLGEGYIVKRMPDTGSHHAPDCPSYEPPAEFSGLGQVLASAITEDPATGVTTLKLDFPLARIPGRSQVPPVGFETGSVRSDGTKLSLRGLLHYMWDQAELTRWHPGFAGRRSWATVRRRLLRVAQHVRAKGDSLGSRLYVPEPFSIDEREAINARRLRQWQLSMALHGKTQQLALLIGEIKEIVPARYGYKAIIKHVPDQPFAVDEQLYRRLGRRFEQELALWGAADDLHLLMIATFTFGAAGVPVLYDLSLMPANKLWIPVEDQYSKQLIDELVADGRSFVKGLRYNLGQDQQAACALLLDCEGSPMTLSIRSGTSVEEALSVDPARPDAPRWEWRIRMGPIPELPAIALSGRVT
jgi:Protein of unknown function (DUF1173)